MYLNLQKCIILPYFISPRKYFFMEYLQSFIYTALKKQDRDDFMINSFISR